MPVSYMPFRTVVETITTAAERLEGEGKFLGAIAQIDGLQRFAESNLNRVKQLLLERHIKAGKAKDTGEDVHTEHCCILHGCKYRDDDCTVVTMKLTQSYPCEDCSGFPDQSGIYEDEEKSCGSI